MSDEDQRQKIIELFLNSEARWLSKNDMMLQEVIPSLPPSWTYALEQTTSMQQAVLKVWGDACSNFTRFCAQLRSAISEIAIVITPSSGYLAYLLDGDDGLNFFLGALPGNAEMIYEAESTLGVTLPETYQRFVKVHNGFLWNGWGDFGVRPLHKLFTIGEMFGHEIISSQEHVGYDPWSLLSVCGDGSGNEYCFHYRSRNLLPTDIVLWDHETWSVSKPATFASFLYSLLVEETRTDDEALL